MKLAFALMAAINAGFTTTEARRASWRPRSDSRFSLADSESGTAAIRPAWATLRQSRLAPCRRDGQPGGDVRQSSDCGATVVTVASKEGMASRAGVLISCRVAFATSSVVDVASRARGFDHARSGFEVCMRTLLISSCPRTLLGVAVWGSEPCGRPQTGRRESRASGGPGGRRLGHVPSRSERRGAVSRAP
jgi:hypothetical protein